MRGRSGRARTGNSGGDSPERRCGRRVASRRGVTGYPPRPSLRWTTARRRLQRLGVLPPLHDALLRLAQREGAVAHVGVEAVFELVLGAGARLFLGPEVLDRVGAAELERDEVVHLVGAGRVPA